MGNQFKRSKLNRKISYSYSSNGRGLILLLLLLQRFHIYTKYYMVIPFSDYDIIHTSVAAVTILIILNQMYTI